MKKLDFCGYPEYFTSLRRTLVGAFTRPSFLLCFKIASYRSNGSFASGHADAACPCLIAIAELKAQGMSASQIGWDQKEDKGEHLSSFKVLLVRVPATNSGSPARFNPSINSFNMSSENAISRNIPSGSRAA
jgi:hypothetical protein